MINTTRCSYCKVRKAQDSDHLCEDCAVNAPANVYVPQLVRQEGIAAYLERIRLEAHKGQRRLDRITVRRGLMSARVTCDDDALDVILCRQRSVTAYRLFTTVTLHEVDGVAYDTLDDAIAAATALLARGG